MRQSTLFSKTRKEAPSDESAKNAKLLIRGGFIHKEMAGVYSYLPLGLRVLNKVNNIIRQEMNKIGGVELLLTSLQDKALWQKTDRWSDEVVDNWFKTNLKSGAELGLAFTHEEPLTNLMLEYIHSFRDLPVYVYQIQPKFRNEARAKSGLMRCREFLMKDLYSFSRSQGEHDAFYEKAKAAYLEIYRRVGIGDRTFVTFASGGSFSKYSHEFQTLSDAGEDIIYVDREKGLAVNREVYDDKVLADLGLNKSDLKEEKAVEVGNIFSLGTKYSEALGLSFIDEKGERHPVIMGSYGIGPGRLIGAVAETLSDNDGLIWPSEIAPFDAHLIEINPKNDSNIRKEAERVCAELEKQGKEVLFDDRDLRVGEKFADADLIGIPVRYVISEKTMAKGSLEMTLRKDKTLQSVKI